MKRFHLARLSAVLMVIGVLLMISGCATIRTSSRAFDTGEVLQPGEKRFTTESVMFLFVPIPGQVSAGMGFEGGWEGTIGWGIHGFTQADVSAEEILQGPEVYVTKQFVDFKDVLKVSATAGADVNVIPNVDALLQTRLTAGFHPTDWFTIYGNAGAAYVTASTQLAPTVGLGLGLDGPFILKAGAYITPDQTESALSSDLLWPIYYGLQIGWRDRSGTESE